MTFAVQCTRFDRQPVAGRPGWSCLIHFRADAGYYAAQGLARTWPRAWWRAWLKVRAERRRQLAEAAAVVPWPPGDSGEPSDPALNYVRPPELFP